MGDVTSQIPDLHDSEIARMGEVIAKLKEAGIAEIFGPGTSIGQIARYFREHARRHPFRRRRYRNWPVPGAGAGEAAGPGGRRRGRRPRSRPESRSWPSACAGSRIRDEVVLRRRYVQQRLIPAFMEPRSVVVDPTGEQYTMWSATQIPHILRWMLSAVSGIAEHKIRVIAPDVGGGFGSKLNVYAEEALALVVAVQVAVAALVWTWAAHRIGKPGKGVA